MVRPIVPVWKPHDSVRITHAGDRSSFVVRRVQTNEAAISLIVAGLLVYLISFFSAGWTFGVGAALVAVGGAAAAARAFRIRIEADQERIEIQNYWRTFRIAWTDVRQVGIGALMQGVLPVPAVAFGLAGGAVVCAQATPRNEHERAKLARELAALAPGSVTWSSDLIDQS
jgi:hypothetical protein